MQKLWLLLAFNLTTLIVPAQDSLTRTRFVIGLSGPELLHTGININLAKFSQVGLSAGIGPSWGEVWPTLNFEHRLYLGKINKFTQRKQWFFKQGATYFPAGDQAALTFTVGGDLKSKARERGWTIDAGIFILYQKDEDLENKIYPALRFQYYAYFKKKGK
jgi:hypothetical protein